jgi:5-methylcytosine-specific restriction protein A
MTLTHDQLYGRRWRAARAGHLRNHPLCVMCKADGRTTEAVIVDHVTPHRGDQKLFWNKSNWQSLCKTHHDATKQRMEHGNVEVDHGCNVDGIPKHWESKPDAYWLGPMSHPRWFTRVKVPMTIVCGAPASGKSTYVKHHMRRASEVLIDLDSIADNTFGVPTRSLGSEQMLHCLRLRNELLKLHMDEVKCTHLWLIVAEPRAVARQWWWDTVKPTRIIVLETPIDACISRAWEDNKHRDVADISKWWDDYSPRRGDIVVR